MAEFVGRYWAFRSRSAGCADQRAADGAVAAPVQLIDHVPARLTASGFAVVGNFEEAVNGWRRDAALWRHGNEGMILAAAAGAVGVRLGGGAAPGVTPDRTKTFEAGAPPTGAAEGSTPGRRRSSATCAASSAWCGARWCSGCCCWRCCRWPT